jgi:hypothetical protein
MIQRRFPVAGSLILTLTLVGCGGGQTTEQPKDGTAGTAADVLSSAGQVAESVVSTVRENLGISAEPTSASAAPITPKAVVKVASVRRARPASATPAPATPAQPLPVEVLADNLAVEPREPAASDDVAALETPVEPVTKNLTLYSAADTDVVPPTPPLGTPLSPWRIHAADAGLSVEVTVADDGRVEKVHMLGTPRLSDTTLLSHIKAWKFTPALRAGEPVRYRVLLQDPVTAP